MGLTYQEQVMGIIASPQYQQEHDVQLRQPKDQWLNGGGGDWSEENTTALIGAIGAALGLTEAIVESSTEKKRREQGMGNAAVNPYGPPVDYVPTTGGSTGGGNTGWIIAGVVGVGLIITIIAMSAKKNNG